MSRLPVLRGKTRIRFASPLAGKLYNNKIYQLSCFGLDHGSSEMGEKEENGLFVSGKSKSIPHCLLKKQPEGGGLGHNPELSVDSFAKTTKIFDLSTRLSDPTKKRCTRSHWKSSESFSSGKEGVISRDMRKAIDLDSSLNKTVMRPKKQKFQFMEIQVVILDLIAEGREEQKIRLDLKRYFHAFFRQNLSGEVFGELVQLVERYMAEMVQMREETVMREGSEQVFNIASKKQLYLRLVQLQSGGKRELMLQLLQYYCLPKRELRDIFLRDVINLLELLLYEQFDLSKENDHVLMSERGVAISDFAQIGFSCKKLYISDKSKAAQNYQRYLLYLKDKVLSKNKSGFRETLKQSFRTYLTQGKYEESTAQLIPFREEVQLKRNNVSRAQKILNFKNDKHNEGRAKLIEFLRRDKQSQSQKQRLRETSKKSPSREVQNKHKGPISIGQRIVLQFRELKRANDYFDPKFKDDQSCKDKVQLQVLIQESAYFKTKNEAQIERILFALDLVGKGERLQDYGYKTISLSEYQEMRNIINCLSNREMIVHFVDRYLGYDQFGEIQKQDLRETLLFIIGGERRTTEVILLTIWSWLQKNGVITNETIRRSNMQLMYERNKLVYYFLISLIFGTNETTVLQLAHDILV